MKVLKFCNALFFFLVLVSCVWIHADAIAASTIVNNWTRYASVVNGSTNTNNWSVSGSTINYTSNNGGTIASNYTVANDFSFSSDVKAITSDNDRYGVVFGFQDAENNYRISWEGGGLADHGFRNLNFIKEVGGTATSLYTLATNWKLNEVHTLTVSRTGNNISMSVSGVASQTFTDTTFMTGRVGLFTLSQTTNFASVNLTQNNKMAASWLGGNSNWSNTAKWNPSVTINNASGTTYDVTINNGTSQVALDTTATINSLTVGANNKLTINSAKVLTVNNDGTTNAGKLTSNGNVTISSGGTLTMNNGTLLGSGSLTNIGTINLNSGGNLLGSGTTATIANSGTLKLNSGTGTIYDLNRITNSGTILATGSSTLNLGGVGTLNNTSGTIKAENGTVNISNDAVIQNGTILSADGGLVKLNNATLNNVNLQKTGTGQYQQLGANVYWLGTIQNQDTYNVENGSKTVINGNTILSNSGNINIKGSGSDTGIHLSTGNLTLSGGGTITLNSATNSKITAADITKKFINQNGKLKGAGQLLAALENIGNVEADVANQVLKVLNKLSGIKNQGQLRALNQAKLYLEGVIDNAQGKIEALNKSTVEIGDVGKIQGGTMNLDTEGKFVAQQGLEAQSLAITMNNSSRLTVANVLSLDQNSSLALGTSRNTIVDATTIISAGTISGSGTLNADVISQGTLSVGNSPGMIETTGDLTLAGITEIEVWGTTTAGVDYDKIVVGGNVVYGGILDILVDTTQVTISDIVNLCFLSYAGSASGWFSEIKFWNANKTQAITGLTVYNDTFNKKLFLSGAVPEISSFFFMLLPLFFAFAYRLKKK